MPTLFFAGGNRANTIHYISNNQLIYDGEMVLMDAGCEYHGYASDITRTWPVSGSTFLHNAELIHRYDYYMAVKDEWLKSVMFARCIFHASVSRAVSS